MLRLISTYLENDELTAKKTRFVARHLRGLADYLEGLATTESILNVSNAADLKGGRVIQTGLSTRPSFTSVNPFGLETIEETFEEQ